MEIRKILFPTDFSKGSEVSASYALDLARRYGARLHVLHVIYDIEKGAGWYVSHINTEELYREMRASAEKEMERLGGEQLEGYKDMEHAVLRGVPYEEIIRYAEDNGVDLIVMGSHGRKGLDRVIFGSTAAKVVKNAHCPVLTVRDTQ
jgi:nucleotide-binding universal stress UspA family protein